MLEPFEHRGDRQSEPAQKVVDEIKAAGGKAIALVHGGCFGGGVGIFSGGDPVVLFANSFQNNGFAISVPLAKQTAAQVK